MLRTFKVRLYHTRPTMNISKAIKQVSTALLFIVYNINIGTINILPNWIGFYLIYKAIQEIGKVERSALLMNKISIFLFVYYLIEWIFHIFMISLDIVPFYLFISILTLYLFYHLFTSISLICESKNSKYTRKIISLRNVLTITFTLSSLSTYLFENEGNIIQLIVLIVYVISMIAMIICLSKISKEVKNYSF